MLSPPHRSLAASHRPGTTRPLSTPNRTVAVPWGPRSRQRTSPMSAASADTPGGDGPLRARPLPVVSPVGVSPPAPKTKRRTPQKLNLRPDDSGHDEVTIDQIVQHLERTVIDTEKKVNRIIASGPTPRNEQSKFQQNVATAPSKRTEEIRKVLRGARRSLRTLLRKQRDLISAESDTASVSTQCDGPDVSLGVSTTTIATQTPPPWHPYDDGRRWVPHSPLDKEGKGLLKIRHALLSALTREHRPTVVEDFRNVNSLLQSKYGIKPKPLPRVGKAQVSSESSEEIEPSPPPAPVRIPLLLPKKPTEEPGKPLEYMIAKILSGRRDVAVPKKSPTVEAVTPPRRKVRPTTVSPAWSTEKIVLTPSKKRRLAPSRAFRTPPHQSPGMELPFSPIPMQSPLRLDF